MIADTHSQLDVSGELPEHALECDHHLPLWVKEEFHFPASQISMDLKKSSENYVHAVKEYVI